MFSVPRSTRILLSAEPVDLRKSIDGLAALVRNGWKEDVFSGHLFVFMSRRSDRVKVLTWESGRFGLYYTRLERGRFRLPSVPEGALGREHGRHPARDAARRHRPEPCAQAGEVGAPRRGRSRRRENVIQHSSVAALPEDHACGWRDEAEKLRAELAEQHEHLAKQAEVAAKQAELVAGMQAQLEKLTRHVFGARSEKMTPIAEELRKKKPRTHEETQAERRAKREARSELPTEVVHHAVAPEKRHCPKCGSEKLKPLGEGKSTTIYEYVPAKLISACTCRRRCRAAAARASSPPTAHRRPSSRASTGRGSSRTW